MGGAPSLRGTERLGIGRRGRTSQSCFLTFVWHCSESGSGWGTCWLRPGWGLEARGGWARGLETLGGALVERVGESVLYKVDLTSLIMHFMGLAFTLTVSHSSMFTRQSREGEEKGKVEGGNSFGMTYSCSK